MLSIAKKVTCGALAGIMLLATAAPAEARHRRHWDRDDDLDAGDIIGAAVVLGGIAAIASAVKNSDGYGGSYGAERRAVDACVREAERGFSRYDSIRVTDVTDVERRGGYYFVRGTLETRGDYDARDDFQARTDGFTCTARGSRIYDFRRSGDYNW
ncbi:MAG TPA: hypothetical protein VGD10_04070 [Allosphingosinicella sp.]|uniref:hypothetical protein n=1 Tax=Allosphingosinicella sp. TaxID=2823234 RepID=UPI002ED9AF66